MINTERNFDTMTTVIHIPPFGHRDELIPDVPDGRQEIVPNVPIISPNQEEVDKFLARELRTNMLERLSPYLTFIARRSGAHIDALDEHIGKGREIVVTENPDLHLVWYYNTLYLKPIPHCLLNYAFWRKYFSRNHQAQPYDVSALGSNCLYALGFLRSYYHLICHESDFKLAVKQHLIPKGISYWDFQIFIHHFSTIPDAAVAHRYHYGQLRLTRLNFVAWLVPPHPLYYHQLDWQMGQHFHRWAPLLLFLWASTNLCLSSIQVIHNTKGAHTWAAFDTISWIFATATLAFLVTFSVFLSIVVLTVYGTQLSFAVNTLRRYWRAREIA
ncbi:hypothetical protein BDV36DRAFT_251250 [Aspergillus pseudocaelatus]|uniref:BSD domain-containing protein n=1 Tax=Aspergillus pseudocaelatus TaxID=1825620 RepID=A0ABQ6WR19_9EURO|nr:hypothetical protein BDV36DRAFT_251250 [Aspergillus pseudocaelatus]